MCREQLTCTRNKAPHFEHHRQQNFYSGSFLLSLGNLKSLIFFLNTLGEILLTFINLVPMVFPCPFYKGKSSRGRGRGRGVLKKRNTGRLRPEADPLPFYITQISARLDCVENLTRQRHDRDQTENQQNAATVDRGCRILLILGLVSIMSLSC